LILAGWDTINAPMKIEVQNLEGHNKKIVVEIPAEKVSEEINTQLRLVQRDAELKGFRKGKAPIQMIRDLYGESLRGRVTQNLVEDSLREALKAHSLLPISMPQIDVGVPLEGVPLTFTATFEAQPPVHLKNYTGFEKDSSTPEIKDEEVSKTLETIQNQLATFESAPADSSVEPGLFVQLDYSASEAGKEVPEASEKNALLEIGAKNLPEDFERNLLGLRNGDEKSFTVKFPNPEKPEERTPMSGRTIDFAVKVHEIRRRVLPQLDDNLAKRVSPQIESVANLKERIRKDLEMQKKQEQKRANQDKCLSWLIEQNPCETPETLVNQQMEQLAMEAGVQLSQMGLDQAAIEEQLKKWGDDMAGRARRQVQASMLLSAIADKEKIQASEEDIRQEIVRLAVQARKAPQEFVDDLRNRGLLGGLIKQITELKALDWVLEKGEA